MPILVISRFDQGISRGTVLVQIPRSSRGMTAKGAWAGNKGRWYNRKAISAAAIWMRMAFRALPRKRTIRSG